MEKNMKKRTKIKTLLATLPILCVLLSVILSCTLSVGAVGGHKMDERIELFSPITVGVYHDGTGGPITVDDDYWYDFSIREITPNGLNYTNTISYARTLAGYSWTQDITLTNNAHTINGQYTMQEVGLSGIGTSIYGYDYTPYILSVACDPLYLDAESGYSWGSPNATDNPINYLLYKVQGITTHTVSVVYEYDAIEIENLEGGGYNYVHYDAQSKSRTFTTSGVGGTVMSIPLFPTEEFSGNHDIYITNLRIGMSFTYGSSLLGGVKNGIHGTISFAVKGGQSDSVYPASIAPLTLIDLAETSGYNRGYDAGYMVGYDYGFDDGENAGYDLGYEDAWASVSPLDFVVKPIESVLDFHIFGEVTLGGILGVLLGISLVLLFLKYFAGG